MKSKHVPLLTKKSMVTPNLLHKIQNHLVKDDFNEKKKKISAKPINKMRFAGAPLIYSEFLQFEGIKDKSRQLQQFCLCKIVALQSCLRCSKETSIWEIWMEFLEEINDDVDLHIHSLERMNIVQMGNRIGSPTTQKYYSEELIDRTNIIIRDFPDYFLNHTEYHDTFFDKLEISVNDAYLFLLTKTMHVHELNCQFTRFSESVYKTFVTEMFSNNDDVFEDEVNLNVRVIFPILQALANAMIDIKFLPGETRLKAIGKELKLLLNDTTHYYNADGTFSIRSSGLELALLETTGKLNHENTPKEVKDYIKAGYGLLSMIHTIGRLYCYADFDIFKKVSVYFVQVTPFKLRLWKFNMLSDKLYCINCIGSVKIPLTQESCEDALRKLINLMWFFKENLESTIKALEEVKASHASNVKTIARKRPGYEEIKKLEVFFKQNANVVLKDKTITNSDALLMDSF